MAINEDDCYKRASLACLIQTPLTVTPSNRRLGIW